MKKTDREGKLCGLIKREAKKEDGRVIIYYSKSDNNEGN